jgi:hypothetical protein
MPTTGCEDGEACVLLYTMNAPYKAANPVMASTTGLYRVSDDEGVVSIVVFVSD